MHLYNGWRFLSHRYRLPGIDLDGEHPVCGTVLESDLTHCRFNFRRGASTTLRHLCAAELSPAEGRVFHPAQGCRYQQYGFRVCVTLEHQATVSQNEIDWLYGLLFWQRDILPTS